MAHNNIEVTIETITPKQAAQYLEANTGNRRFSPRHIKQLAVDIGQGNWQFNGDAIKFNGDGTLLDGQHRLQACVDTGKAFKTVVVRGLSAEAQITMDTGKPRSFADHLTMHGVPYAILVSAICTTLREIKTGAPMPVKFSNIEKQEFLNQHPAIAEAATAVFPVAKLIPPSICGSWFYLAHDLSRHKSDAEAALDVLKTGEPAYKGDPMHALRERFVKDRALGSRHSQRGDERLRWCWTMIGCFNKFVARERQTVVRVAVGPVKLSGLNYDRI